MGTRNTLGVNIFDGIGPLTNGTDLFSTTGKIVYVGSVAVPGGVVGVDDATVGDRPQQPYATLDFANNQLTANRGDMIVALPGHAETVTAAIAFDTAGVRIVGLGLGRNRPTVTRSGAIDSIAISAADVRMDNIRVLGTADTAGSLINISATDCVLTNMMLEHGVGPTDAVTLEVGSDRFVCKDSYFLGTAAGPDLGISFEGLGSDNILIENVMFNYAEFNLDEAAIQCGAGTVEGGIIKNVTAIGMILTAIDFNSSASVSDGLVIDCTFQAKAALTSIENLLDAGGYHFSGVTGQDGTNATTACAPIPLGTVS